ncbi:MAG: DUF433 domain-containing protein [Acidobacteria bacterium]|nr:DUF433 domain-containing protein [Acidobacteriota bacterium]
MNWRDRIKADPAILVGKPVIKGTRLAVDFILSLMAQGWTEADLVSNYPGLAHEDIQACLQYASEVIGGEKTFPRAV